MHNENWHDTESCKQFMLFLSKFITHLLKVEPLHRKRMTVSDLICLYIRRCAISRTFRAQQPDWPGMPLDCGWCLHPVVLHASRTLCLLSLTHGHGGCSGNKHIHDILTSLPDNINQRHGTAPTLSSQIIQIVDVFHLVLESQVSLPSSREPVFGLYPEPVQFSCHLNNLFL
jgi:hypothetical protein